MALALQGHPWLPSWIPPPQVCITDVLHDTYQDLYFFTTLSVDFVSVEDLLTEMSAAGDQGPPLSDIPLTPALALNRTGHKASSKRDYVKRMNAYGAQGIQWEHSHGDQQSTCAFSEC